jgi:hypothetical protein
MGDAVAGIVEALGAGRPELSVRLEQEVTPESLWRVGVGELAAAVVMESPMAARRHGVRLDSLRDEPLLAALPRSHRYAAVGGDPDWGVRGRPGAAAARAAGTDVQCVAAQRDPSAWVRARVDVAIASAPWDRRLPPVASGEAVSVMVAERARERGTGLVGVPFDPPLNFPMDLISRWPATEDVDALVQMALRVRDSDGWLTERPAHTELPRD